MLIYLKKSKMKKHIITILILITCALFIYFNVQKPKQYKVIEALGADYICVDLNNNNNCENEEKFKIFGISAFPQKFGKQTEFIKERYLIEEKDSVVLGVMGKDFTEKTLLNRFIEINILDTMNDNYKPAKIIFNNEDFAQTLLKKGWVLASNNGNYKIYENMPAIKKNIKFSKNFNYQLRNNKNGKIHTLDCEYGRMSSDYEIGIFNDAKYKKDFCQYCHKENKKTQKALEKLSFDYLNKDIKVYFLDFTKQLKPDSTCSKEACKILLQNINNSKESIDFAIYGFGKVPKIKEALINASNRGVKIRCILDENSKNENPYEMTDVLKSSLKDCKTDYINTESTKFNNFIMHNKFFIFDNSRVWLGTANISETDLSGFSANNVILIDSSRLAEIYEAEFERMYDGDFHTRKSLNSSELPTFKIGETIVKIAFSPQNRTISNHLIKMINNAKKSIYIETFIITHKEFAQSLVDAKNRGVDVKIIVDATGAANNYSMVNFLRNNGIKVKVENYAGKMHMKTLLIDGEYFISGSLNLTKSGDQYNDENLVFIKNTQLTKKSTDFFNYIWLKIPDKYLYRNAAAESKESTGSCNDGIDNDYNGKIDSEDEKCR